MSAGDLTLIQCFGFPPFIRLTGEFYRDGTYQGLAGLGVVGIKNNVNSGVLEWRRPGFYYGNETQVPKEVGLSSPSMFFDYSTSRDFLQSYTLKASA